MQCRLGNCGISLKNKLQHLQNRAVELIYSDSELVTLNAAFKELSLLNVQQLIDCSTTTLVYDSIHGNCPEYLADRFIPASNIHNYQTRHARNGLFPTHMNLVAKNIPEQRLPLMELSASDLTECTYSSKLQKEFIQIYHGITALAEPQLQLMINTLTHIYTL